MLIILLTSFSADDDHGLIITGFSLWRHIKALFLLFLTEVILFMRFKGVFGYSRKLSRIYFSY